MTEQEQQAYDALYRWADRLNKWEYAKQKQRNNGKKLKQFTPNYIGDILIAGMKDLTNGRKTADEVMSLLHIPEVAGELREAMNAGF